MTIHELAKLIATELINDHDSVEHVCNHMNELILATTIVK